MSWRCDMLTLMSNQTHLLQNLEASHIPLRLFYYYYFFLGLPTCGFREMRLLSFISENPADTMYLAHILLALLTNVADKSHTGSPSLQEPPLRVIQNTLFSDPNIEGTWKKTQFNRRNPTTFCLLCPAPVSIKQTSRYRE